VGLRSVER